jgi:hypothetical protein
MLTGVDFPIVADEMSNVLLMPNQASPISRAGVVAETRSEVGAHPSN